MKVPPRCVNSRGLGRTLLGGIDVVDATCAVDGCGGPRRKREWCDTHYRRWLRTGDVHATVGVKRGSVEVRFWSKVDKSSDCWLWVGALDTGGYGQFRLRGRNHKAHRISYELLVGPIPDGLTLDHVRVRGCQHRNCVNPAHLEPVTLVENISRSDGLGPANARKTHCLRNHPFDAANTYWTSAGARQCRQCIRDARRSA